MSSDDSESGSDLNSVLSGVSDSDNDSLSDTDDGDGKPLLLFKFVTSSDGDEGTQVKIQENVLNSLLKSCGDHRLSVICSVGGVRTGKSFILNCIKEKLKTMENGDDGGSLLNRNLVYQGFPFKSSYKAVTKGIWVWSKPFIVEAEDDEVAVILMDCEGINDQFSRPEEIAVILGIPLLLSSVLIFNFSGDLSSTSFDWISTFMKKGSKHHQNQQQKFQNLSLVVHDWTRLGIARYGVKGGRKVLDQYKNQNISQLGAVMNGFENVECFLLPHIGEKALQDNFSGKAGDLNKDFSTQLQRYINDLLAAGNLATKKIFDNDLTPEEFKHFVEDYTKFFNESPELEFGLKPESISNVTMETAGKMKISRSLDEYNKVFKQRQKGEDYLRETVINALHVQARRKALEIFKSFELPREQEKVFELKFEHELMRINREMKAANVTFRDNKISENLEKAYEKLKVGLEENFPFQPEPTSRVSVDMVFYADEHLENVLRTTKEQAETEFLEEFEGDDDSEIAALRRALHATLKPLENDYLRKNLENRDRAEEKAEKAIDKLMEGYLTAMQKKIKKLKKIDAETLEEFSNGEVEKMEEKFKGMGIGTYEFTQEWLDNMMEKVQEELESMQLSLESTMAEAIKLVTEEEKSYKEDLSEKASEMDEDDILNYHEERVDVILRRFKTDNPFPADNPKHDQVETKLKVKLQSVYEKVVTDGILLKRKQEEELENTMDSTVKTMERDLSKVIDEAEFMEVDECESYMKSREEEIQQQFTEKVERIGADKDKLEEYMDNFKERTRNVMQKSLKDNNERRQLAIEEADQLVDKCAAEYESKMSSNLEELNSLEELRTAHQNIRENVVQQFVKTTTTKNQKLIAKSIQKLEYRVDEMSEEIEDLFNMKKESEDKALFGAIMEVKKFYQESMDRQFANNKSGFFKEKELARMDRQTHQAAINSLTTDTPLNGKQKGKLEEQLNKLFQKYKEKNALIQHSYKNTRDAAIGIDLGTTYCCVAVYHMGQVKIIRNSLGENTTPSYVTINADETTIVGATAKKQSFRNPESTVFDAKRILGRRLDDEKLKEDMKFWPFIVEEKDGKAQIKVHGKYYHPEHISGMILKHLKKEAEDIMGMKINKAVITVPAYFTDGQRQATVDAGELAGLKVLGILNEPTAAAVAYRLEWYTHGKPRKVLIYDLGGGTFDVAVLEISEDKINVLSISGDSHLGGEDFDKAMMDHCVTEFKKGSAIDLMEGKLSGDKIRVDEAKRSLKRLQLNCEEAKKQLSTARSTTIAIDEIVRGRDLSVDIRREKFEGMNDDLFRKTIEIVEKALESAKVGKDEIDDVVLVGGSTRIGKLQDMLQAYFPNNALNRQINPDEAVAYGAAVQAAILNASPGTKLFDFGEIQEVTPMSLGIEVANKEMDVIIPKNTKIPTEIKQEYRTHRSGQTTASIRIFQGEEIMAAENKLLGTFVLGGIPPGPSGQECVDVRMIIDRNGILSVEAICRSTKGKNSITVSEEKGRMSKEEKRRILAE